MDNTPPWEIDNQQTQQASQTQSQNTGGGDTPPWEAEQKLAVAQQPQQQNNDPGSFLDFVESFNRQFEKTAEGGLQLGLQMLNSVGIDTPNLNASLIKMKQDRDEQYAAAQQRSPIASKVGTALGVVGDITNKVAFTGGLGWGKGVLDTAGKSAIAGAGLSALDYTEPGQSKVEHIMEGGALGGLIGGLAPVAAKGFAAAGKDLGGRVMNAISSRPVQEAADELSKTGYMTLGQATGNKTISSVEQGLGSLSGIGTKGAAKKAVAGITDDASGVLSKAGVGTSSLEDLGQQLKGQFKQSYDDAVAKTNQAYDKAMNIADSNNLSIPLTNTNSLAQDALAKNQELIKSGFSSADISGSKVGNLLDDLSNVNQIPAKQFDLVRKQLGGMIQSLKKGTDNLEMLPTLQKIKVGMDQDLAKLGDSVGGEFGQALNDARNMYISNKLPFKSDPVLKKIVDEGLDSDKLLNSVIKNSQPQLTRKIYGVLNSEGQQTFTTSILSKVASKATDDLGNLDLSKLQKGLSNLGETVNALPDNIANQVKGLQKTLAYGQHLIKTANKTPNTLSNQLAGGGLMTGAATGHLPAVLAGGAVIKGISSILKNQTLVKNLIKLGGGKLAAPAAESAMSKIFEALKSPQGAGVLGNLLQNR